MSASKREAKMYPNQCGDCQERTLRNNRGDAFNPTANPDSTAMFSANEGQALAPGMAQSQEHGLEELSQCTSSFGQVKSYFRVSLMRCLQCGAIWLLGYYEDFDAVPIEAEWGLRTWTWRPLTSEHLAQIEAAKGTGTLDVKSFGTTP